MKRTTLWLVFLIVWTSLAVPVPLSSSAMPDSPPIPVAALAPMQTDSTVTSASLTDAVNQWIKRISGEPGFETWRNVSWTSQPLGPGTHGWIILIQSKGQETGYMVVHAADPSNPSRYRLTEYGSGSTPLFSLQTLYRSLVQLELIDTSYRAERIYIDPLHAVWSVTSGEHHYYLDAKTGEPLPIRTLEAMPETKPSDNISAQAESPLLPEHTIISSLQLQVFDPYERLPWVKGNPAQYSAWSELRLELERQKKLTYAAALYDGQVTVPLAVTGYHQWSNEQAFLLLEQNGSRAISYDTASKYGKLYP